MKLPALRGIIAVYRDQNSARIAEDTIAPGRKNVHHLKEKGKPEDEIATEPREPARAQPLEETKQVCLFPEDPQKTVTISTLLDSSTEEKLIQFLREFSDTFAWSVEDLRAVDRKLIEHSLNISNKYPPVKQKLRKMSEERKQAAKEEV